MKVKLFLNNGKLFGKSDLVEKFSKEINTWLENHPELKVIDIKQSSCGGSMEPGQHLISVWYESES